MSLRLGWPVAVVILSLYFYYYIQSSVDLFGRCDAQFSNSHAITALGQGYTIFHSHFNESRAYSNVQ